MIVLDCIHVNLRFVSSDVSNNIYCVLPFLWLLASYFRYGLHACDYM